MKRKLNTKMDAAKKKCAILLSLMICLSFLAGCQSADDAESSEDNFIVQPVAVPESDDDAGRDITASDSSDVSDSTDNQTIPSDDQTILSESNLADSEASDSNKVEEVVNSEEGGQNKYTIEGFAFADGMEKPVCVTLRVKSIQRGEEAYEILQGYNPDITLSNENEEYIIVTFNVSYDSGEIEELYMMENRASLEQAGLYFALSNGQSNANDVTSYLSNSIYDISLVKGQSGQGAVAFLQEKGNTEPLVFVGFEQTVRFNIN